MLYFLVSPRNLPQLLIIKINWGESLLLTAQRCRSSIGAEREKCGLLYSSLHLTAPCVLKQKFVNWDMYSHGIPRDFPRGTQARIVSKESISRLRFPPYTPLILVCLKNALQAMLSHLPPFRFVINFPLSQKKCVRLTIWCLLRVY